MKITDVKHPLAITMWDSSWIRRRYAGGGFESFDQALDELKERGYNAVRIDAFPHMVANAPDGTNDERFLDVPGVSHHKYGFAQWGNQWTVYIYPRRDLVDFIRKAKQRGIYVALSTWLKPTWEHRNELVEGPEGLIRVWHETLCFLQENDCLDNILYVDVHNEIPRGAVNTWLAQQLNCMKLPVAPHGYNDRQKTFYRTYFHQVLSTLKQRWPDLSFTASYELDIFLSDAKEWDFRDFDLLDVHVWAQMAPLGFLEGTGYDENIRRFGDPDRFYLNAAMNGYTGSIKAMAGDFHFESVNAAIQQSWQSNRTQLVEWLDEQMQTIARIGREAGIPVGNTEGWGSVFWLEHPMLEWDMVKDAGLTAAKLGAKHGYAFNCQSNFCEPQYLRLWRDVDYHREVTSTIRGI